MDGEGADADHKKEKNNMVKTIDAMKMAKKLKVNSKKMKGAKPKNSTNPKITIDRAWVAFAELIEATKDTPEWCEFLATISEYKKWVPGICIMGNCFRQMFDAIIEEMNK